MRAQVAMEYLLAMMFATVLLVGYLAAVLGYQQGAIEVERQQEAERVASIIQQEIIIASQVRDGYQRHFELPDEIAHAPYTIRADNQTIRVEASRATATRFVPPYQGTPTPGDNNLTKQGGEVVFT